MTNRTRQVRLQINLDISQDCARQIIHDKIRTCVSLSQEKPDAAVGVHKPSTPAAQRGGQESNTSASAGMKPPQAALKEGVVQARMRIMSTGEQTSDVIIELQKTYPVENDTDLLNRYLLRNIAWNVFCNFFRNQA